LKGPLPSAKSTKLPFDHVPDFTGTLLAKIASGKLRNILPDWQGPPGSVYAVTETRLLSAKTQRFIEFLSARLR
jgi:DNA-binding transcriptional LysR family regulator